MSVNSQASTETGKRAKVEIRSLREEDLDAADHAMRMAFGTYLQAPDPLAVFGDSDHVHSRYPAQHVEAFCAELDGEVVGSNFATRWGSFGFFGPLTVHPDQWDSGIGVRLMEPIMDSFEQWGVQHAGLFTFPESAKHIGLYQKHGFWPQQLTPLLAKPPAPQSDAFGTTYAEACERGERDEALAACRGVSDAILPGLDLEQEMIATDSEGLGETLLLEGGEALDGFAICHCGPGTEAGSGACFIKFGAVRPGGGAAERFERLVDACEALAAARGLERMVAGCNTARQGAYRHLLERGYGAFLNGVLMLKPDEPATNRPDAWVIDDLR